MGAWGTGIFENDSALDWVDDLISNKEKSLLFSTLSKVKDTEKVSIFKKLFKRNNEIYIEEPDGSEILAAAEVVACLKGNPDSNLPEGLAEWIDSNKSHEILKLVELAKTAVKIVKERSEIKELWQESDEFKRWLSIVEELERRL